MRKIMLGSALTAALALSAPSVAGADHTGCEPHARTGTAHGAVPHMDKHQEGRGTHKAHSSIPYCPPHDAPRHKQESTDAH